MPELGFSTWKVNSGVDVDRLMAFNPSFKCPIVIHFTPNSRPMLSKTIMVLTFFAHSTGLETTNSGSAAADFSVLRLRLTGAAAAAAVDG